jgi:hypothetical protein
MRYIELILGLLDVIFFLAIWFLDYFDLVLFLLCLQRICKCIHSLESVVEGLRCRSSACVWDVWSLAIGCLCFPV